MGLLGFGSKSRGGAHKVQKALDKMLRGKPVPAIPQLTLKVLQKVRDPACETEEIAATLEWDPVLVVRVLKTVNTAAYGPATAIENVRHAVSYMGRAQLEQVVLAVAVSDALPSGPARGFDSLRFWSAASKRAALSRILADELHPARSAEAFTGGLLQDLAIPILAHSRPDDYGPILERWHAEGHTSLPAIEREVVGWTHADVGGLLARNWELPEGLSSQIFRHHRDEAGANELLPSLALVSVLRETEEEHGVDALVAVARSDFGLAADWTKAALAEADAQAHELAQLLS
ncbi:MAG: HDOD domain-containing protein [Planctomycetota bacterium]